MQLFERFTSYTALFSIYLYDLLKSNLQHNTQIQRSEDRALNNSV